MKWTQITVAVSPKDIDTAGNIAQMVVPYGIHIEDYANLEEDIKEVANTNLIDEDLLKKDRSRAFVHIYMNPEENPKEAISFLSERYKGESINHKITTKGFEEEDWLNNWKKYFNPIKIGRKLLILPTWRKNKNFEERLILNLDPGAAFGTGGHETTKLCLESLERYVKKDDEVLDIGCGSGVLSIASCLLGAKSAKGVDIDKNAVKIAKENVKLNKMSKEIEIVVGNLTDKIKGKYNIIVANIVADAIISLSSSVKNFMKEDGLYIMSGIIDTRLQEVLTEVNKNFTVIDVNEDKGWACVIAKLKS